MTARRWALSGRWSGARGNGNARDRGLCGAHRRRRDRPAPVRPRTCRARISGSPPATGRRPSTTARRRPSPRPGFRRSRSTAAGSPERSVRLRLRPGADPGQDCRCGAVAVARRLAPGSDRHVPALRARESDVMAPGLADLHPDIQTYSGRGIDDPAATIHADLSPLGFHASVRSTERRLVHRPVLPPRPERLRELLRPRRPTPTRTRPFVERDADAAELSVDEGYYHAADTVTRPRQRVRGERRGHDHDLGSRGALRVAHAERAVRRARRRSTRASSPTRTATSRRTSSTATRRRVVGVGELPGRARRRPDRRSADRRRPADVPARPDHRPGLRRLLRRPGERHRGEGRADEPRRPGLRGRPLDQAPADREQRPAEPRHVGRGDRAERAVRRRGLLHAVAGHGLLEHHARAVRDRPDHRRVELRHRPPRARPAGRRRRQPRRRRPLEQGRRLHGHPDADRRLLRRSTTWRTRWATSSAATIRSTATSSTAPAATATPPPRSSPAAARRSWRTRASASPTTCSRTATRTSRSAASRRSRPTPSSNQAAINEVQTASLRHFGGGNEVQVVTFGPGYAPAATIQPLTPRDQRGAERAPRAAAPRRTAPRSRSRRGDRAHAPGRRLGHDRRRRRRRATTARSRSRRSRRSRSFQVHEPDLRPRRPPAAARSRSPRRARPSPAPRSRSGPSAAHSRSVGDVVVDRRRRRRRLQRHVSRSPRCRRRARSSTRTPTAGLANSGGGTATFFSPFQVRIGGDDSAVIGGSGLPYTNANLHDRDQRDRRASRARRRSPARPRPASRSRTPAPRPGIDVPNIQLVNLSCGGCFASVEETNHGGANDSFTLNYNGNASAPITNGTNYTAAGILRRADADPAGRRNRARSRASAAARSTTPASRSRSAATLAATNVPVTLARAGLHRRARPASSARPTRAAPSTTRAASITPTGERVPGRHRARHVHDPAADAVRPHRQRDRRGRRPADSTAGSRTTAAARPARRC